MADTSSSNSSTLPWAEKTGNLTLRPDSVVHSIIYDEKKGKATGVRVIDAKTKQVNRIFCADHFCKCRLPEQQPHFIEFHFQPLSEWVWAMIMIS